MYYKLQNGKSVLIPDAEIEKNSRILKISKDDAIKMWLEDEGYELNEIQENLTKKAKPLMRTIHQAGKEVKPKTTKKTQRERVLKTDTVKENIIKLIYDTIEKEEMTENVKITNKSKMVEFSINGECFSINLVRHRQPKK